MPSLLTGLFAVLYTIFVYFEVLLKEDQDYTWIFAIFCGTWIVVYLTKKLIDICPYKYARDLIKFGLGTGIIINLAPLTRIRIRRLKVSGESIDTTLFFTATCFSALYFLFIRESAKGFKWNNKPSFKYDSLRCILAVSHLNFLYSSMVDHLVKNMEETERQTYILHLIILVLMSALGTFDLLAFSNDNLVLKEEPFEDHKDHKRPGSIEYQMEVDRAFEEYWRTVGSKHFHF